MVPASDTHLESKASALACRSKAEALDSSGPGPRLAGTMTKAFLFDLRPASKGIKTSTGWMRGLAVSNLDHHAGHGLVSVALQGDQESAPSAAQRTLRPRDPRVRCADQRPPGSRGGRSAGGWAAHPDTAAPDDGHRCALPILQSTILPAPVSFARTRPYPFGLPGTAVRAADPIPSWSRRTPRWSWSP